MVISLCNYHTRYKMNGFIKISKYAGMREDLVQAGGGNSSYKVSGEKMYIKASGFQLAEVTEQEGYAIVNPKVIQDAFLDNDNLESMTDATSKVILQRAFCEGKKPSIETFLHAVSGKYTLHTHPIVVNAMTCRVGGMDVLKSMFPGALIVPYATPGVDLAVSYFKSYQESKEQEGQIFDIVFLQNHGLVVSADSPEKVIEKTEEVVQRLEAFLQVDMSAYHRCTELWELFPDQVVWNVTDHHVIDIYQKKSEMWKYNFCPDCIVFMGKEVLRLSDAPTKQEIKMFQERYGKPVIVVYKEKLYIVAESVKKALEIQSVCSFSAQVMHLNESMECNMLEEQEQNFLLNWDAEKYRKNMK